MTYDQSPFVASNCPALGNVVKLHHLFLPTSKQNMDHFYTMGAEYIKREKITCQIIYVRWKSRPWLQVKFSWSWQMAGQKINPLCSNLTSSCNAQSLFVAHVLHQTYMYGTISAHK